VWQRVVIGAKKDELAEQQALDKATKHITQAQLTQVAKEIQKKKMLLKEASAKYEGLAALGELSKITPPNIRVERATLTFSSNAAAPTAPVRGRKAAPSPGGTGRSMNIQGVIMGATDNFDALLTNYLIMLQGSALFDQPSLEEKGVKDYLIGEVMSFTVNIPLK